MEQKKYVGKKELWMFGLGAGGQGMIYAMMSSYISDYYLNVWKQKLPKDVLKGRKIVLDTANGATVFTTLPLLRYLGADLIAFGDQPNGENINRDCGSEHADRLQTVVKQHNAWLGFAHDGDGDRLVVIDEQGQRLDGDQLLGLLALDFYERGCLKNNCLVVTEESNSGLVKSLQPFGIRVATCDVGDRNVFYKLEEEGAILGGESSGHVIFKDEAPTGDGLRVLLELLKLAQQKPLHERAQAITLCSQCTASLTVTFGTTVAFECDKGTLGENLRSHPHPLFGNGKQIAVFG